MDAVFDAMIRSKCSTHIRCFLVVVLTYCGLRWGLVRKALRIYMILGRFSEVPLRIVVQLWVAFYIRANRLQTKRCATTTSELVKSTYLSPARRLAWTTQHWNSWHRSLYLIFWSAGDLLSCVSSCKRFKHRFTKGTSPVTKFENLINTIFINTTYSAARGKSSAPGPWRVG